MGWKDAPVVSEGGWQNAPVVEEEPQPQAAPGSEPMSVGQYAPKFMGNPIESLSKMGAFGAVPFMLLEGMRQSTAGLDRAAYQAGGAVTDIATKAGASPQVAAGLGYGTNVGVQTIPMFLGGMVGERLPLGLKVGGRKLMQSALKPSARALQSGEAQRAIQTMLDEGVNVTPGGIVKMNNLIDDLYTKVDDIIKGSTGTVSKLEAAKAARSKISEFKDLVNRRAPLESARKVWKEFTEDFPDVMSVQKAQDVKRATQRFLDKSYGQIGTAETETQKAIAAGLRKGIEKAEPGVVPLNKRQAALINARDIAEYRAEMAANRDVTGLAPIGFAGNPAMGGLMLADRNPWIKSYLARMLYNLPGPLGMLGGAYVGSQMGRPPE